VPSARSESETYSVTTVAGAICAYHINPTDLSAFQYSSEHPCEDKACFERGRMAIISSGENLLTPYKRIFSKYNRV